VARNIDTLFKHSFCINLDRRPDRWEKSKDEFDKVGLSVNRYSAVDGPEVLSDDISKKYRGYKVDRDPKAIIGCLRSHRNLYTMALTAGWQEMAVFEDDVVFKNDFRSLFETFCDQLPVDWLMLFLGCIPLKISNFSNNLRVVQNCWTTHAYIIRREACEMLETILSNNEHRPIDLSWGPVLNTGRVFTMWPFLAIQRESYSDIMRTTRSPFKGKYTLNE